MRKQYHLRSSLRGLLAWDVHRLIALTETQALPHVSIPLSSIRELDECFWFQDENSPPTCRAIAEHAKLIAETDLAYPLILSSDGRVMDGMHRVAKALMLGREHITAVQFTADPEPDYIGVPEDKLPY
ncbi:hypothetical protein DES53_10225 [Roseimicrobium gellanilyticum]|uniref:ParB-like nuclease family protein n=1 Tax=Roseimicrobium gellanilyticum TaxID=748857 RepID=A0A366HRW5_9BACT|nr:hypothetical protein [Roseimicrobium gellanilyticum]RBP45643.1 hypothetical protein DES53_10225 [Roseimicrobium gellanilyticum]